MSRSLPTGVTLLAAALLAGLIAISAQAQSGAPVQIIAMDANPSGNTATSLGPLNACVRAEPGQSIDLDLVVDAVPDERGIIGFEINVDYTPNVLEMTAVDYEFLLAAEGSFEPFVGLSQTLPDTDGRYLISVADLQSNDGGPGGNVESGPGVLARITFKALTPGLATVGPAFDPPTVYPSIIDMFNEVISSNTVASATVAVGQDCPVPPEATVAPTAIPSYDDVLATPTPTPPAGLTPAPSDDASTGRPTATTSGPATGTPEPGSLPGPGGNPSGDEDGGGTGAGTIVIVAVLAVAGLGLAAAGGWMLYRRRGAGEDAGA